MSHAKEMLLSALVFSFKKTYFALFKHIIYLYHVLVETNISNTDWKPGQMKPKLTAQRDTTRGQRENLFDSFLSFW